MIIGIIITIIFASLLIYGVKKFTDQFDINKDNINE